MNMLPSKDAFYFHDPRLTMSGTGRLLIRVITSATYGLLTAAAVIFLLSDPVFLKSLGILITLFLIDRFFHIGKPDVSLVRITPVEGRINVARYLTPETYRIIESAFERTRFLEEQLPLALLDILIRRRDLAISLERMDVPLKELSEKLKTAIAQKNTEYSKESLTKEVQALALFACISALNNGSHAVLPRHLFGALGELHNAALENLMVQFAIAKEDLDLAVHFGEVKRRAGRIRAHTTARFMNRNVRQRERVMNRAWTARPTPTLDRFGEDLTMLGRAGRVGFLVGHSDAYKAMLDVLSRPGNPNVLLIGDPGVGKEALVERLAFQIATDRVPAPLFDRRLVSLSLGSLTAGADQAEISARVRTIISEIELAGNIILHIPDIHTLVKSGGALAMSAADVFLPAIKGVNFSVIGATYPRDFKTYIEPSGDFKSAFDIVRVEELSEEDSIHLLIYESLLLEEEYGVVVSFKAIKQSVRLAHQYFRDKLLPGSAEDVLREAVAGAVQAKKNTLQEGDVLETVERRVKVPLKTASADEAKQLLELESVIHKRLVDQEEAVSAVSRAMREYRSGLSRKGGPIATFLFVGPTGVGKTELAKTLARIEFRGEEFMLRFDMSEYQTKESITRFLGTADGTVSGALTDAVREKPYSLILLDEFEKAHPDILNLFLQVFDDGRLTDAIGRTIDFKNAIIVATSNAHSTFIKEEIEKGTAMNIISDALLGKLTDYFKAELLNRFSSIIVFKPLSKGDIKRIAEMNLIDLQSSIAASHGIELSFTDEAIEKVGILGFDPVFGARPLRRVVSEKVRGPLAEKILKGELIRGSKITISVLNDAFTFDHV